MPSKDVVPRCLAVQAMRDNGYKNAAYALAELMDNSIQAGATLVELLCLEREKLVNERYRKQLDQIAVLDNGGGMTPDVLRAALQFGNGTRLAPSAQTGIGKFGMGLPSASISQCAKVEVWTWQDGPASAVYTYLDLTEIKEQTLRAIPAPIAQAIPNVWQQMSENLHGDGCPTGTLVVWSRLDKCQWRTAATLKKGTEKVIGRLYRHFISGGQVRVRLVEAELEALSPNLKRHSIESTDARPNDPGYLIAETSCPAPFSTVAMFEARPGPDGQPCEYRRPIQVKFNGRDYPVKLTFSVAKDDARRGFNTGSEPHGKHASDNVGVSLVRAGRELEMDQGLVIAYSPVERWWGVEVEFPPALDEVFGVTNNKQAARHFADLTREDVETLIGSDRQIHQAQTQMGYDDDPRAPLLPVIVAIDNEIKAMRRYLGDQGRAVGRNAAPSGGSNPGIVAPPRPPRPTATEAQATRAANARHESGFSAANIAALVPNDIAHVAETLRSDGVVGAEAEAEAARIVGAGLRFNLVHADLQTNAFFAVKPIGGTIVVELNTAHPAYEKLLEILEADPDRATPDQLRDRLENAKKGLELLLFAWAQYEQEQPDGPRRNAARNAREDWGSVARTFLE